MFTGKVRLSISCSGPQKPCFSAFLTLNCLCKPPRMWITEWPCVDLWKCASLDVRQSETKINQHKKKTKHQLDVSQTDPKVDHSFLYVKIVHIALQMPPKTAVKKYVIRHTTKQFPVMHSLPADGNMFKIREVAESSVSSALYGSSKTTFIWPETGIHMPNLFLKEARLSQNIKR